DLHRLAVVDGQIVVDPRRITGRSAYLCRDRNCWELAEKRRALDRALGVRAAAGDWERLHQGILI
ncbi:MAG: YlxR family protein, partial [Chloroflexi bacterium]